MYATGAQRQAIAVLLHLGICESYTGLVRKVAWSSKSGDAEIAAPPIAKTNQDDVPAAIVPAIGSSAPNQRKAGSLPQLSASCREDAREVARSDMVGTVYDNVNFRQDVAETTLAAKGKTIPSFSPC